MIRKSIRQKRQRAAEGTKKAPAKTSKKGSSKKGTTTPAAPKKAVKTPKKGKRPMTAAQKAALAKGRAIRAKQIANGTYKKTYKKSK